MKKFLSNFFEDDFVFEGQWYKTAEGAFQAQKDPEHAHEFEFLTGEEAHRKGKSGPLPRDWNQKHIDIMRKVLEAKFSLPHLQELLLLEEGEIVEDNTWNDTFWGVCNGRGENHLGKLLTEVRANPPKLFKIAFTGHRNLSHDPRVIKEAFYKALNEVRKEGQLLVRNGLADGFDSLMLESCFDLEEPVHYQCMSPNKGHYTTRASKCKNELSTFKFFDKVDNPKVIQWVRNTIGSGFDTYYKAEYVKQLIYRNGTLVAGSTGTAPVDVLFAYYGHTKYSGAKVTIALANSMGIPIINLWDYL